MKEFKTIVMPVGEADNFDEEINECVKNGWRLVKRMIQTIRNDNQATWKYKALLYAELERREADD